RCDEKFGLRIGDGISHRARKFVRPAGADRSGARSHLWFCFDERLERARYPSLGISTARAFSGEEFFNKHFALGRDDGSARTVSKATPEARSGATAVSAREKRFHLRHSTRSQIANRENEKPAHDHADELPKSLLECGATARASHR